MKHFGRSQSWLLKSPPQRFPASRWQSRLKAFNGARYLQSSAVPLRDGPLVDVPSVVLDLDALDSPYVRPYTAEDEEYLASKWSHEPEVDLMLERMKKFRRDLDHTKDAWERELQPFDQGKISNRDVLSVAFLGATETSPDGSVLDEQSLSREVLRSVGITDRITNDQDLLLLLLHRQKLQKARLEQETVPSTSRLIREFKKSLVGQKLPAIQRSVTALLSYLPNDSGIRVLLQCRYDITLAATEQVELLGDDHAMRVIMFLRNLEVRLTSNGYSLLRLAPGTTLELPLKPQGGNSAGAQERRSSRLQNLLARSEKPNDSLFLLGETGALRILWHAWQGLSDFSPAPGDMTKLNRFAQAFLQASVSLRNMNLARTEVVTAFESATGNYLLDEKMDIKAIRDLEAAVGVGKDMTLRQTESADGAAYGDMVMQALSMRFAAQIENAMGEEDTEQGIQSVLDVVWSPFVDEWVRQQRGKTKA